MYALFDFIIWFSLISIPSKKQKRIRKNIKIIKQELWFPTFVEKEGPLIFFNNDIRILISNYNLQDASFRNENMLKLKGELEECIQKGNV